jgi:hypothetical protein
LYILDFGFSHRFLCHRDTIGQQHVAGFGLKLYLRKPKLSLLKAGSF